MTSIDDLKKSLAIANRMFANEGVLDAFGHVGLRHPDNPERFFLARSLAPAEVTADDILEFDMTSEPVEPFSGMLYSERVMYGAIFRARPDVNAICHHHAPAMLPFCLADLKLRVVTQLGATIGKQVPLWDQRDEFGATNHLVMKEDEAVSLAKCLGTNSIVLMKRHGATVVASDLRELAFRTIYSVRDAELQLRAMTYGDIDVFNDAEIELAGKFPEASLSRAWDYWVARMRGPAGS
ncbi:MAG: class II aldolase/adducin family protein [Pseudolabrys sp.]|nr:class II aldolase/adducin family protein [Pseudolabrys sp.]